MSENKEATIVSCPVESGITIFVHLVLCGVWRVVLCGVVCGVAVWHGVVWCCGVAWCGVACGVVWHGVVCGVAVWHGVVWCGVMWCGWFGVVWCGVVWWDMGDVLMVKRTQIKKFNFL